MKIVTITTFLFLTWLHVTSSYRDCRDLDFEEDTRSTFYANVTDFVTSSDGKACKLQDEHGIPTLSSGLLNAKPRAYFIRKIDLRNNSIQRIEKDPFASSGLCVVVLDLSYNKISTIMPGAFSGLPIVQKLDLSNNNLESINNEAFLKGNKLDVLLLQNNRLKVLQNVTVFSNVTVLNLGNNSLSLAPGMFKEFPRLIELNLSQNNISYIPLGVFEGVGKLELLHLANNQLKYFQTGTFSGIPSLKLLNISFNFVDHIELINGKVFFPVSKITTLILDGNSNLTDLNATALSTQFPRLLYLGIGQMPWVCPELLKFFMECQRHYIDFTKHSDSVLRHTNIHGVKCIDEESESVTESTKKIECNNSSPSAVQAVFNAVQYPEQDHKEKLLTELKTICVVLIGFICVLLLVVAYKQKRHWFRKETYNGQSFTNYKLSSSRSNVEDAEGNLDLISEMN